MEDVEKDEKDNMLEIESEKGTKSSNHFFSGPTKKADERNEEGGNEPSQGPRLQRGTLSVTKP